MSSHVPPLSMAELDEATRLGLFGFPVPEEIARIEPGAPRGMLPRLDAEIARQKLGRRLVLAERIAANAPDLPALEIQVADTHYRLGNAAAILTEMTSARHHFSAAAAIAEKLSSLDPGDSSYRYYATHSLLFLAGIAVDGGRRDEALRLCARVEELLAPLVAQGTCWPEVPEMLAEIRTAAARRPPDSSGRRDPDPPGGTEPRPDDAETFSGLFNFLGL